MTCLAYLRKIGRPTVRKAAPKRRPRMECLKLRAHAISTSDPRGVAMAEMVQLLPRSYTFESVTAALTHSLFDQS